VDQLIPRIASYTVLKNVPIQMALKRKIYQRKWIVPVTKTLRATVMQIPGKCGPTHHEHKALDFLVHQADFPKRILYIWGFLLHMPSLVRTKREDKHMINCEVTLGCTLWVLHATKWTYIYIYIYSMFLHGIFIIYKILVCYVLYIAYSLGPKY